MFVSEIEVMWKHTTKQHLRKALLMLSVIVIAVAFITSVFAPMTQQYPLVIESAWTTDMQGNSKTSFARGEFVVVHVKLKYPSPPAYYYYQQPGAPISYLLIVEVLTPDQEVLALGFTTGTLSPGDSVETGYGFKIPYDAPTGTYKIKVLVWNGWPAVMGGNWAALAEPEELTITVTSG